MSKLIIYIDGGSRGNPGPSAFGVVFSGGGGASASKTYSQSIGVATNNEAEYQGLIFALKKAKSLFGKDKVKNMDIEIRTDSELLAKQMNGEYKVISPQIQQLFLEAWNLKIDYKKLVIVSVAREQNKIADGLVNEALDGLAKTQKLF